MKKIFTFAIVGLLISTILFGSVFAFGDKTGLVETFDELENAQQVEQPSFFESIKQRMFIRQILNRLADRLHLTDEQKAQIKIIVQTEVPVVKPILMNGVAIHKQLAPLGRDGVYDEATVNRLAGLQATNARKLIVEKEKVKAQIFAILTPEQRAEVEKIRDEFEARIMERIKQTMTEKF